MALIITLVIILAILGGGGVIGYHFYRRGLRFAKGIERGIKMVPILINLPPASEDAEVGGRDVRDVMTERISQAEVLYNLIASTATKGFKSKFFGQRHVSLELVAIDGVIRFYAAVPVAMVSVIKQAVLTAYPGAQLEEVEDHNIFSQSGKLSGTYGGELVLKKEYTYPIATFNQLKSDAVSGLINGLKSLEQGDGASIQILLRPAREEWSKKSESVAKELRESKDSSGISIKHLLQAPFKVPEGGGDDDKPPKQLNSIEQSTVEAIEEKTKSTGYEVLIRVIASSSTASKAQAITNSIVASFSLFDAPGLNGFTFEPAKNMEQFVTDFIFRFFPPERRQMILNSVELATLFHFPDDQFTKTSQVQRQNSKQVEGPSKIPSTGLLIGHNEYHGVKKEIRISDADRRRHVYIVGQTGTGKSTMLENMMVQDMQAGKGFAFIDPHGDAAETLLGMLPKERSEDVIYFDPGDLDHPLGLNLFEYHSEDQKDFLIQESINMLYRLYDPTRMGIIGPRYEHMFRNAALTVMADPAGGTFVDIPKLFRDPQFVKEKLKHVEDKTVQEFWQKEIPQAQRSNDFGEIMSWFVSKFGAFLSNQMMRNIIGQSQSAFDLRQVMDSNKILIANLSKGRLGELNSQLLGMIFVMKFQAAAMSRASIPEEQRRDFSLYVDEFQNFSTESFAHILSEARKYHLNMIVANQFISQLSEEVREAVFGNVGTIVSFRTGPNDADFLVKQFSPVFNDRDLVNLPNFTAAARLLIDNVPTQPFNLAALPPLGSTNPQLAQALKQLSALKYGSSRQEVEDTIFDRLSTKPPPSPFDSLASSRSGEETPASASASAPPAQAPDSSGSNSSQDSSFLDEWLAKRRQAMQSQSSGAAANKSGQKQSQPNQPQRPQQQTPSPSTDQQTPSGTTPPSAGAAGSPPAAPASKSVSSSSSGTDTPSSSAQPHQATRHDKQPGSSDTEADSAHHEKVIEPPPEDSDSRDKLLAALDNHPPPRGGEYIAPPKEQEEGVQQSTESSAAATVGGAQANQEANTSEQPSAYQVSEPVAQNQTQASEQQPPPQPQSATPPQDPATQLAATEIQSTSASGQSAGNAGEATSDPEAVGADTPADSSEQPQATEALRTNSPDIDTTQSSDRPDQSGGSTSGAKTQSGSEPAPESEPEPKPKTTATDSTPPSDASATPTPTEPAAEPKTPPAPAKTNADTPTAAKEGITSAAASKTDTGNDAGIKEGAESGSESEPDIQPEPENLDDSQASASANTEASDATQAETASKAAPPQDPDPGEVVAPERDTAADASSTDKPSGASEPAAASAPGGSAKTPASDTAKTSAQPTSDSDAAPEETEAEQTPAGQEAIAQQLSSDLGAPVSVNQSTTPEEDKGEEQAAPASQPAQGKQDPAIANLKPGEVYIDEEGNVHRG